ncbi:MULTISPECIES: glycosyltransferase [unclassified Rhizobium]|uniref:glycosyltransferase n=1 Tax=unclassified Rhizobium TaxID=2613769 RepID=UPI00146EE7A6|nr:MULTISPECIES: glycosyltransferase [unclassified Rhizobium]MBD9449524.1 glycosyltransferase [Rhizobium sp. RHZ01]NMN74127.1 Glycosyltransferase [Rhizobium sp. 57MFTsu3.2]
MSAREFAINGRFLTQGVTGVQRYARNVLGAMDKFTGADGATLIVPTKTPEPSLQRMKLEKGGQLSGHAWEQIELPYLSNNRRLLNLCNTAPALKADQIVCIHDANIFAAPQSYSRAFRALYHNLQPLLVRRSLRVASVSHAAARQIARHLPIRLSDIAILPNGHEHALSWNPELAELAPKALSSITADRPFVLALGSRARHKNLSLLIDIAPELDEMNLDVVIAGGGDGIFAEQTLQRRPNVHFIGRVSDHDLAYLLDRALCLVFPSLTEGFGLPIVEAMARSCPVISSHCASMPEVCGNAAMTASPFEPREWIKAVRTLVASVHLRSDLAGRGREQVRQFSWEKTASGYIELLDKPKAELRSHKSVAPTGPHACVIFATRGRPEIVTASVRHFLSTQSLKPDAVIVSCVDASDAGDLTSHPDVTIVTGPPGLAAQRNTALKHVTSGTEIVAFFDDDFIADKDWLATAIQTFRDESQIVGFTGHVVADGIKGPGISYQDAVDLVRAGQADATWAEPISPYGCNMAFRFSAIGSVRFDERLVLYGWLEDRDFAAAIAKHGGRLVKSALAFGVHMGVKSGRVSGERLGYSQVINPLYMMTKGTMSLPKVVDHIFRNTASNFSRAVWPEPFIDRRGRARGNIMAAFDALRGRLEPERAAAITMPKPATRTS